MTKVSDFAPRNPPQSGCLVLALIAGGTAFLSVLVVVLL